MIIYEESVGTFIKDCLCVTPKTTDISDIVERQMKLHGITYFDASQKRAWQASLPEVAKVLQASLIDRAVDVAIEYKPSSSNDRVDFLICGTDALGNKNVVVLELKQWSDASESNYKYFVFTNGGGGTKSYWHPSYQAGNYANIIRNFNEYVQKESVGLYSCSFLHNMPEKLNGFLNDEELFPLVKTSPAFLCEDTKKLQDFLERYVSKPYRDPAKGLTLLFKIDNSKLKPSDQLADSLKESLEGNDFFSYDEGQATAVSTIVATVREAKINNQKKSIIIKGRPGSGKSVVALNAMGQLIHGEVKDRKHTKQLTAVYVTANSTPKKMYKQELIQEDFTKAFLSQLFKDPSSFQKCKENEFDCIFVDEGHRIYHYAQGSHGIPKSGPDGIELLIKSALVTIFFVDKDQQVTMFDYGTIDNIKKAAQKYDSTIIEGTDLELTSEFRCLGGSDYIGFIRGFLGYEDGYSQYSQNLNKYDFRVFDNATDMMDEIIKKDKEEQDRIKEKTGSLKLKSGRCRVVAGYTYNWVTKGKERTEEGSDINLDSDTDKPFHAKWNLNCPSTGVDYCWLDDPDSVREVGCIHTCQGLDLLYCGVIIGKDLRYNENTKSIEFHREANAKTDTASGISSSTVTDELAKKLIRNTYNVLLTRGVKGTFVYCEDKALSNYLKSLLK